jgi:hypothetical protein
MSSNNLFSGLATAIGSLPHKDMDKALDLVFEYVPDCPHWPQLQSLRYTEGMEIQPVEGLPGIRHNPEKKSVYVDTVGGEEELAKFYEDALAAEAGEGLDKFAMSPDYAEGFHAFLNRLETLDKKFPLLKAQIIAPFSFGYTIRDQDGKSIIFHPAWGDACMKILALKSVWQINKLKPYADEILYFLDEPMLSSYGSTAMLTVSKDEVIDKLNQVVGPIKKAGAICAMHCCGRTDWALVMESNLDVINFDTYNYGSSLGIYPDETNAFLERGGWFAPGIIPMLDGIDDVDEKSVLEKLNSWFEEMGKSGISKDLLKSQTIVTPACGCGPLSIEQTKKVYRILKYLQENFNK